MTLKAKKYKSRSFLLSVSLALSMYVVLFFEGGVWVGFLKPHHFVESACFLVLGWWCAESGQSFKRVLAITVFSSLFMGWVIGAYHGTSSLIALAFCLALIVPLPLGWVTFKILKKLKKSKDTT